MWNSKAIGPALALVTILLCGSYALAQSASTPDVTDAGKAVFKRANCFGCHKWHGNGGGGYGGDALSLRKTELTRDQIIEIVTCGRPGTGMPYFARGSYETNKCYEMNRQDVADRIPPEGGTFLRAPDIEAVADYVLVHIKGKGEPNYNECVTFFNNTSRVCDVYKEGAASIGGSAAGNGPAK
jgi:mono/diheme cytochrome c family protein